MSKIPFWLAIISRVIGIIICLLGMMTIHNEPLQTILMLLALNDLFIFCLAMTLFFAELSLKVKL